MTLQPHNDGQQTSSTESSETIANSGSSTDSEITPKPTYKSEFDEEVHSRTHVSPQNPLGELYSGDVGSVWRATHLAYGDCHGDVTTNVSYELHTTDPTTNAKTTETRTEEVTARSLYYHSELVEQERINSVLEEMPTDYNAFNREAITELINDLKPGTKIAVARVCSPAIYLWHNDLPTLAGKINKYLSEEVYPDELYVVDTGDEHTYPNKIADKNIEEYQPGSWQLIRMWWD